VAQQDYRPPAAVASQARVDVSPAGTRLEHARVYARLFKYRREKVCATRLVARWIYGVDAYVARQQFDRAAAGPVRCRLAEGLDTHLGTNRGRDFFDTGASGRGPLGHRRG